MTRNLAMTIAAIALLTVGLTAASTRAVMITGDGWTASAGDAAPSGKFLHFAGSPAGTTNFKVGFQPDTLVGDADGEEFVFEFDMKVVTAPVRTQHDIRIAQDEDNNSVINNSIQPTNAPLNEGLGWFRLTSPFTVTTSDETDDDVDNPTSEIRFPGGTSLNGIKSFVRGGDSFEAFYDNISLRRVSDGQEMLPNGPFTFESDEVGSAPANVFDQGNPDTFEVVPEPASLALFGLGGLLIAGRRRRQA